ncbi:CCR4-NOT transcription complex subunit 1-like [Culex quinquefasciatus]|uniref:CCR4-NOT transcription complex subunit 1-like n=1 Tax=Culex quinquefasciatus TaxID=7176 RepID=UPI0018E35A6A|nr:CCR4-NOT transcription complex subunit 1-like [Culex quinquefasciatus]
MDTALGSLVMEIGYTLTASLEDCKNHLPKIGDRKNTAQDVAKIISSMCLTHASLSESPVVHARHSCCTKRAYVESS